MYSAVAVEKMDVLLSEEKAWSSVNGVDDTEIDDVRLTECGEGFLQMLMAITDRYKILPQPGHKYSSFHFYHRRSKNLREHEQLLTISKILQ